MLLLLGLFWASSIPKTLLLRPPWPAAAPDTRCLSVRPPSDPSVPQFLLFSPFFSEYLRVPALFAAQLCAPFAPSLRLGNIGAGSPDLGWLVLEEPQSPSRGPGDWHPRGCGWEGRRERVPGRANPFLRLSRSCRAEIPSFPRGKSGDGSVSGPAEAAVRDRRGIGGGLGVPRLAVPSGGGTKARIREFPMLLPAGWGHGGWHGLGALPARGDRRHPKTPSEGKECLDGHALQLDRASQPSSR